MCLVAVEYLCHCRAGLVPVKAIPVARPMPVAAQTEGAVLEGAAVADLAAGNVCPAGVAITLQFPLPPSGAVP